MIKITIESVGRDSPRKTGSLFNVSRETVLDIKEAQEFLTERYGKMPGGRNKIYVDDKDGNATVLGFTHSFWSSDISHDSKPWLQTDWITAVHVVETPVNILTKRT
jgi:hypothetical protein